MLLDEIKKGESKNIEFKIELPVKQDKYMKTIVAFCNGTGGKLIIGVEDETRTIKGVDKSDVFRIMDKIANEISDSCYPQIIPNITFHTFDEKCIVVVEIYPGPNRPYYIKAIGKEHGTYIRIAGTSRPVDLVMLKELELQGIHKSFDEMIHLETKLHEDSIERLCTDMKMYMMKNSLNKKDDTTYDVKAQNLENWGLLKRIENTLYPTNAFILLTENSFQFAKIQCALFKGVNRAIFIDRKEFDGPLYLQIENAYQFVLRHINLGAVIDGLFREDKYELPPNAIREAIVNSVLHRNFMEQSCIQVAVFDDRVEITSPGVLFGGLTLNQIKDGNSKIRNAKIAEVFSRMKIIENWGTGIQRMIQGCIDHGVKVPEFKEIDTSFRVNFYRSQYHTPKYNIETNLETNLQTDLETNLEKLKKDKEISQAELQVVRHMQNNPNITIDELGEILHKTRSGIKYTINSLKRKSIIERTGSTKAGKWKIL